MELPTPTLADVLDARRRIAPYLSPTPLRSYAAVDELLGTRAFVKHENHQPTGAFKVRGGVNLVSRLTPAERERGVVCASTGNHGQSIAFAAQLFSTPATVCVPEGANPLKVAAIEGFGATVVERGHDFDDARVHAEQLARAQGSRYVHSGDEPLLIAGVGTGTLELLEQEPTVDTIVVPIGGGSGAAGACVVAKAVNPSIRVIGVQSSAAPAAWQSWREGRLVESTMETFAEGLATRTAFALPQRILRESLDDFVLVDDDAIRSAQRRLIEGTRTLVEAAGAAALAAAVALREQLAGRRVALVASGGNVTREQLLELLA
jgi:threonine dehydratase